MANIVLVAGGWHGGWYYASIARQLRARGNEVFTPTLTGLGERIHLSGACPNLDTHIDRSIAIRESVQDVKFTLILAIVLFLVLNGLERGAQLVPGRSYKIVAE